jgi:hypothetical protein
MPAPRVPLRLGVLLGCVLLIAGAIVLLARDEGTVAIRRTSPPAPESRAAVQEPQVMPLAVPAASRRDDAVAPLPAAPVVSLAVSPAPASHAALLTGVVLRDGRPVGGAEVRLHRLGRPAVDRDPAPPEPALTDGSGRFAIAVDPGGNGTLTAVLGDAISAPSDAVTLSASSRHEMTLRLTSLPWIDGVVVDADGHGMPYAVVTLFQDTDPLPSGVVPAIGLSWAQDSSIQIDATADEQGRFEINPRRPTPATIVAYADQSPPSDPVVVDVASRPHATLTLRLNRGTFISGRVRTSRSKPYRGLALVAKPSDETPSSLPGHPSKARLIWSSAYAVTDAEGSFRLGPLHPAGVFDVLFFQDQSFSDPLSVSHIAAGTPGLDVVLDPQVK